MYLLNMQGIHWIRRALCSMAKPNATIHMTLPSEDIGVESLEPRGMAHVTRLKRGMASTQSICVFVEPVEVEQG